MTNLARAVLVVMISRKNFEHDEKPSVTHQFDAGAAWENLALQGETQGLVTHGMQGFDYEKARRDLSIPDTFDVMARVAIGKPAPKEILRTEVQQREEASDRKPLAEIIIEGQFTEPGIDVFKGKVADLSTRDIYEPLTVKNQVINSATEAARMILRMEI